MRVMLNLSREGMKYYIIEAFYIDFVMSSDNIRCNMKYKFLNELWNICIEEFNWD